jgi:sec-independent protein translocase protein TatB
MFPEGRALEFLLAAVIALVVVGPKDLPVLMRKLGQFVGRMRALAAEFRASFDEMARQSELDELRKEVEAMRRAQFADVASQAGQAEVHDTLADIRQNMSGVAEDLHAAQTPPYPYYAAPSEPAVVEEHALPVEASPAKKTRARRAAAEEVPVKTVAKPRARKKAEPEA